MPTGRQKTFRRVRSVQSDVCSAGSPTCFGSALIRCQRSSSRRWSKRGWAWPPLDAGQEQAAAHVPNGKLTLTEFAARLGIGTRAVRRIPVLDDVAPGPRGGASRLYFTLEELEAARVAIDTATDARETAFALGLRVTDLASLERASLLRCVPNRDRNSRTKAYHRPDVSTLLSRLSDLGNRPSRRSGSSARRPPCDAGAGSWRASSCRGRSPRRDEEGGAVGSAP